MTRIYLVRHGRTERSEENLFRGQADIPLSETGKKQALALADALSGEQIKFVCSSPLSRGLDTASVIAGKFNLTVQTLEGLNDTNFGEWEGKSLKEVEEKYPELFKVWQSAPADLIFPGGETLTRAKNRAVAAIREIVDAHSDQTGVVVSHRATCKLIILDCLGLNEAGFWSIRQDLACINLLEWDGQHWTVRFMNLTSHLKDAGG